MSEQPTLSKIAKQRRHQVLKAIDQLAAHDQLAFLTTQRVSKASGISDGVLFRHFASKDAMLTTWVEQRGEQLRRLLEAMPAGRNGLMYVLQQVLAQDAILTFICCQAMDTPYLRQQLEACRGQFYRVMQIRIEVMHHVPIGVSPEALTDHLIQSIYRAWNPNNPKRNTQKEFLMNQLPWEKSETTQGLFPDQDVLQRLALNDSGFVFDPLNGRSFSANPVGLYVLRFLQSYKQETDKDQRIDALMRNIDHDFDVSPADAQRDITEFSAQLRKFLA